MRLEHSDPTVFYLKNVPVDRNGRYETPEGKERGGGLPMLITWVRMMQNPLQHGNIFGRLVKPIAKRFSQGMVADMF